MSDIRSPAISVVMPMFNVASYIEEAISSILNQDFRDFELLLIDDGSSDETVNLVQTFLSDSRVRLLCNEANIGLISTLNKAYLLCRAPFIARMDADDISHSSRLRLQLSFLRDNPEVAIVGGAIRFFGNVPPNTFQFPVSHDAIRPAMLFYCPLAHPALMFRRELIDKGVVFYDDNFRHAEDYHLWSRLLLQVKSANLPDVVLDYRLHAQQVSSESSSKQYQASLRVRRQMLLECGIEPSDEEVSLHESVILERPHQSADYFQRLSNWFNRIESANSISGYWDSQQLHTLLKAKFVEVARRNANNLAELASQAGVERYIDSNDVVLKTEPSVLLFRRIKQRIRVVLYRFVDIAKKLQ